MRHNYQNGNLWIGLFTRRISLTISSQNIHVWR